MVQQLKNKKGFTLVELVIVLAIGALIIAAVLVAVGGAQKSRRDSQRRNDTASLISALESYASNNNGSYPPTLAGGANTTVLDKYFTATDPSTGNRYTFNSTQPTNPGDLRYALSAECNGNSVTSLTNQNRKYAVVSYLETGDVYCKDNK